MKLGPWEIGLIVLMVLIIFGVGKLPQIGGAVGKTIREFRTSSHVENDRKDSHKQDETVAG